VIGTLGGLIGLGGAEFRLPVLVGLFQFSTLHAVVINLAVSLVTVCSSLIFRASSIPFAQVADSWPVILNLLAGSLFGSYIGVHFATKINERMLNRIVLVFLVFLVFLGFVLISHGLIAPGSGGLEMAPVVRILLGVAAGSIVGEFVGSYLLPYVSAHLLKTVLGVILLISAVKLFYRHKR